MYNSYLSDKKGENSLQNAKKVRLLLLTKILTKYTDDEHPLSACELSDKLKNFGISVNRKTIYSDISALTEFGLDIIKTYAPKAGFFLGQRIIDTYEARLLIDYIISAPFLSNKKTSLLIDKLSSFISIYQYEKITSQMLPFEKKCTNEEVFYNIDIIYNAIAMGHSIAFKYVNVGRTEKISLVPHSLNIINNDYYLSGLTFNNNMVRYKISNIKSVSIIKSKIYPAKNDTVNQKLKKEKIQLICDNSMFEQISEFLGQNIITAPFGEKKFIATSTTYISDSIIDWLVARGDKIYIKAPLYVRKKVIERINNIRSCYNNFN